MLNFLRRWVKLEHAQAQAMLSAYVDGELTDRDQQLVEGHLTHCDACAEDVRTLRYTKSLLVEAPMPRLPRSFVIRQADLESRSATVPRRAFGLHTGLAYAYLRGATAVVVVAFALLVAGDFITQPAPGYIQPAMAPVKEASVEEQAVAVEAPKAVVEKEVTKIVEVEKVVTQIVKETVIVEGTPQVIETIVVESVVEKEAEKIVVPAAQVSPTASPSARDAEPESVLSVAGPEETLTPAVTDENLLPTKGVVAEQTTQAYSEGPTPTTKPSPTATTPLPTPLPTATPSPTIPEGVDDGSHGEKESYRWPSAMRMAEIGLGGLALILLIVTLVVRRQQS
jgi:anti-sigma factor RsiW